LGYISRVFKEFIAKGRSQGAEGRRQEAEGRRQEAGGRKEEKPFPI
jgi:hypothetical protein